MLLPQNFKKSLPFHIFFFLFSILSLSRGAFAAEIFVNPATGTLDKENFTITITVDSADEVDIRNVTTYVKYNPSYIQVLQMNPGDFSSYPTLDNNKSTGIIKIVAANTQGISSTGIITLATVNFKSLINSGFVDIDILNTGANVSSVENSLGENLLTSASSSSLLVDINVPKTSPTSESSRPIIPKTGHNWNFEVLLISAALIIVSFVIRKNA